MILVQSGHTLRNPLQRSMKYYEWYYFHSMKIKQEQGYCNCGYIPIWLGDYGAPGKDHYDQ